MPKKSGNRNRLLNPHWVSHSQGEWRLWDRSGDLWHLAERELSRAETERLYFDSSVSVAVSEAAGPMTWIEPTDRRRRWNEELRDRAFDEGWRSGGGDDGDLPFEAMRFERDGAELLLFYDND